MYTEADLLPLSALQHFVFCPRQCALIHIEQQWVENRYTAEGRAQHDRVDRNEHECRGNVIIEFALPLRSLKLGVIGKADAVEFRKGVPYPVEHKRGKPKPNHSDWVQVCAQALCLEEMLHLSVPEGAIFYGKPRRRQVVEFNSILREETETVCKQVHELFATRQTPTAIYNIKKCSSCSLFEICMPENHKNVKRYIKDYAK